MRRHRSFLVALVLILGISSTTWAMDFDFDDLFGGDLLVELEEEEQIRPPEEALLVQEGLDVGGNYQFSVTAGRRYLKNTDPTDSLRASLGGQIYLDARPDPNFRVFGKAGLSYAVSKQVGQAGQASDPLQIRLQELFSDFNYDNKVFFRAGKQNVKWGVGYFFSPADVISVGRINPMDPEVELEGPVALKMHYPRGSTNYYVYTLFDGVEEPSQVALAPKLEFVLGGTEIGVGGFYQKDKAPRAMLTVSSSLGNLAVFGEAVVSKGSDIPFFDQDKLYFHGTVGARYSHNDPDGIFNMTGAAQYYFSGEPTGRHYLAAMIGWNNLLNTKLSASAYLNANLSDQSGMVTTTLKLPSISKISPSVGVSFNYGDVATEFDGVGRNTTVFAAITLGSGSF